MVDAGGEGVLNVQVDADKLAASGTELEEERQQFWEMQENVSVVCARAPDFQAACIMTRVDEKTRLDPDGAVQYQPWQIIGEAVR